MNTRISLPGVRSPGVGFDQPFDMLDACHERVRRTLRLLSDLRIYLHTHVCDDSARQAARDVLRYFDKAAPQHHKDEELHVFPALLGRCGDSARVVDGVRQLMEDHLAMEREWSDLRLVLEALGDGRSQAFTPAEEAAFDAFAQRYDSHLHLEDDVIYPAARPLFDEDQQQSMGREMAARRRG